jgi:hypothetical protein
VGARVNVTVGVRVIVGVSVIVGVKVIVRVRVIVGVSVGVRVRVLVGVLGIKLAWVVLSLSSVVVITLVVPVMSPVQSIKL